MELKATLPKGILTTNMTETEEHAQKTLNMKKLKFWEIMLSLKAKGQKENEASFEVISSV